MLAVSALITPLQKASTTVSILFPTLASSPPIVNTILTMLRRWLSGKNIFTPDQKYLHHCLLDSGISRRQVVMMMYFLSALFGSPGIRLILKRNETVGWFLVLLTGFGLAWW